MFFSIIFIAVMCVYSIWLTLIVVISLPMYAAISMAMNPTLRARLNENSTVVPTTSPSWSNRYQALKRSSPWRSSRNSFGGGTVSWRRTLQLGSE